MSDDPNRPNRFAPLVAGVVLAGGLARRMGGGDKPLKAIAGTPMLDRVVDRLRPQCASLALNANGDPARFAPYGLAVIPDAIEGFAGPLAGVAAGMLWARAALPDCRWIATVAGDTPFFPADLVARFIGAAGHDEAMIALAKSGDRVHPVFGLWPVAHADDLMAFLEAGETRKVLAWVDRHPRVDVTFPALTLDGIAVDPFFNVNEPDDIATAEAIAAALADEDAA